MNAMQIKARQCVFVSKNALVEKSQKAYACVIEQWQKQKVYDRFLKKTHTKLKIIFSTAKDFIVEKYQHAYAFIKKNGYKKEAYLQQVKKIIISAQKKLIPVWVYLVAKYTMLSAFVVKKINEHEKLAFFLKKIRLKIEKIYSETKCFIIKWYQTTSTEIQQYEWYKQLYEASTREVRKITLWTGFFINILALAYPLSLMQVYDRVIPNQTYSTLVVLTTGATIAIILEMILRMARSYINLWCDAKYEYILSKKAFSNLLHVPLYIYENTDIGTRIKQFAVLDQMRGFYNNQLLVAICDMPFLIIFLFVIFYIGGWLIIVPLFLTGILVHLSFKHIDEWQDALEKKLAYESRESDFLVNVLSSIHTAKSLGIENLLIRRYERMQHAAVEINFESTVQSADLVTVKSVASQGSTILMAGLGAISVMHGNIAVGSLIACILISGRYMLPLVRGLAIFSRWKMINTIRGQLDIILNLPVEKKMDSVDIKGVIQLRDISYQSKLDGKSYCVFRNVNLEIQPHTVVTIIGDSKADAEKLLNILAAVTCPTTGEYLIDGKNVDQYQNYQLRSKITYLSKMGALFHGSIMDNLSAFNQHLIPVAIRFAKELDLDQVVSKLPQGYDTMVGDKAVATLPFSVINLIYIIRALVNKPKIILFDEADMDLDTRSTEKLINLLKILKEIATIIILSKNADEIHYSDVVYELKNKELKRVPFDVKR